MPATSPLVRTLTCAPVTALVTGVTGFTGGHLARHLVHRGVTVRGLVRPQSQRTWTC